MIIDDTIAAIATGITNAGIGIIRVSGRDAVSIVDKIFKDHSLAKCITTIKREGLYLENIEYNKAKSIIDRRIYEYVEKNNTNGLLLDREKFSTLLANLNLLIIDNYDDNFELIPPVRKILEAMPPPT